MCSRFENKDKTVIGVANDILTVKQEELLGLN
jgi:hypothetical protein